MRHGYQLLKRVVVEALLIIMTYNRIERVSELMADTSIYQAQELILSHRLVVEKAVRDVDNLNDYPLLAIRDLF